MNKADKAMLALLAAQLDVLLSMQASGKGGHPAPGAEIAAARKLAEKYRAARPARAKKKGKAAKRR